MFLFHSASVVSSIGAEEARPAFDTRMSMPPNSHRSLGEGGDYLVFLGHVDLHRPDEIRAERLAELGIGLGQRRFVDIGQHHAGALAEQPPRRRPADAAGPRR